jgi:hypothetical protein
MFWGTVGGVGHARLYGDGTLFPDCAEGEKMRDHNETVIRNFAVSIFTYHLRYSDKGRVWMQCYEH